MHKGYDILEKRDEDDNFKLLLCFTQAPISTDPGPVAGSSHDVHDSCALLCKVR